MKTVTIDSVLKITAEKVRDKIADKEDKEDILDIYNTPIQTINGITISIGLIAIKHPNVVATAFPPLNPANIGKI